MGLGPVYGYEWRHFEGQDVFDQLRKLLKIKTNPHSRRLIVSAWHPAYIERMALPPCHLLFSLCQNGKLSLAIPKIS